MGKSKTKSPDHVPFGKIIAWGTRPIALGAVTILTMYLSLYCTDTLKMPAALVGSLLMASKIFDGITDLLAGWLVDNTNTRWGKGRPYELCIIGVWICTFAMFAASDKWSLAGKSVWLFIMYTLVFSIFSTLLNTAETPYIIRAFHSQMAVVKVASYSGIFVTIGSMIVSITLPIVIGSMGSTVAGWRKLVGMYAIPLVLIGLVRFFFVKEEAEVVEEAKPEEKVGMKEILQAVRTNKYVWLMSIVFMVPSLLTSLSANTYYFTWIVGDIKKMSILSMLGLIGLVLVLFFPTLMKKFSAMQIIGFTAVTAIAGYAILFFAGKNMGLLILGSVLIGFVSLPTSYMKSPVIMQLCDYNEINGNARMEATMSAVVNFMNKLAGAFGSFLLGIMLSMGGYDGNLSVQPDKALTMIRMIFSVVPAIFMVIVLICVFAYRPLDKLLDERKKETV